MNFSEQVALVIGGSGGVGRAVVLMLAERGARVVVGYHSQAERAAAAVAACAAVGAEAVAAELDVRSRESLDAVVEATLERWGQLDVLINCASARGYAPFDELTGEAWRAALATNLDGAYHACKAVLRPMMKRRYGRIVHVSGLRGVGGMPGQADFSAADGGVFGLTRALAREVAAWNITVNAVATGLIATDQLDVIPAERQTWGEKVIALRRVGTPKEAAAAAVFLASPLASYITGQTLAVDGGWRMA